MDIWLLSCDDLPLGAYSTRERAEAACAARYPRGMGPWRGASAASDCVMATAHGPEPVDLLIIERFALDAAVPAGLSWTGE